VLKKVRVAFELKDDDIIALLQRTGLRLSKTEPRRFLSPTRPQELPRAWGPGPQELPERPVIAVTQSSGSAA
jgi:hypothetical protein